MVLFHFHSRSKCIGNPVPRSVTVSESALKNGPPLDAVPESRDTHPRSRRRPDRSHSEAGSRPSERTLLAGISIMSISFTCPSCGRHYNVNESLAGRKVRCKSCGSPVKVPASAETSDLDDPYGLADQEPPSNPEPQEEQEPVVPTKSARKPARARTSSSQSHDGSTRSSFRKAILFVIGFGVVAYVMPMFGLVLKPKGAHRGSTPTPSSRSDSPSPSSARSSWESRSQARACVPA